MATVWLGIFLLLQVSWSFPMHFRKHNGLTLMRNKVESPGDQNNFIKRSGVDYHFRERMGTFLEMAGGRRSNRQDILKYHRAQCTYMSQPWIQSQDIIYQQDPGVMFLFRVYTGPLRPTFPRPNLFKYMSRIYRCCKLGFTCKRVKGLQGTWTHGNGRKEVEFSIDSDIFNLSILRAELHLEVSLGSNQLTVVPVLTAKGITLSSFTTLRSDHVMELALDVMSLLQMLKETDTEDTMSEEVTELSLALHCIHNEHPAPCHLYGVSLLHPPFLALHYE
ncbi:uncharacterized protein XB5848002.L [Xenopus laevis]|uniref:Uncharacterized protein XB5848002.L n=2 Tax=Xenopus laevis TaxID=8355 RepID=A0A1L8I053_XENLA|nr:uncharacterized protein XB5848002.L [Xenopus laevis]OCU01724.1 hypothetical protein XELAEV_18007500mg [Xenopus laevis]